MYWTQQQAQRIRDGLHVAGSHEADEGSTADLLLVRKIPSKCMCNSSSEDRTWVELQEAVVRGYSSWLRSAAASATATTQKVRSWDSSVSHEEDAGGKRARKNTNKEFCAEQVATNTTPNAKKRSSHFAGSKVNVI